MESPSREQTGQRRTAVGQEAGGEASTAAMGRNSCFLSRAEGALRILKPERDRITAVGSQEVVIHKSVRITVTGPWP